MSFLLFLLILLSIFLVLISLLSPFILLYGLINIRYDLEEEKMSIRFLGIKYSEIYYSNIENIEKISINPYLDFKKIKNRPIKIYFKKPVGSIFRFKIAFIYPKDRDAFYEKLKLKYQN